MKRLAAWVLILTMLPVGWLLPGKTGALAAGLMVEIASCSEGNGSTVAMGTTVHFSIRAEEAERTQLMIVPPDSSRIGAEGPETDVTLDQEGTWAFVAYAKGADGTLVHSEQWRIRVEGDPQAATTPEPGKTDVRLFTLNEGDRFEYDEKAEVFWTAPDAEPGTYGWLNLFSGTQLISGSSIPTAEAAGGSLDVTDALRKGGRGQYRAEIKLRLGTEEAGQAEITLELTDRYMDFADEISGVNGREAKLAFDKWRRNTKPMDDQKNSGYLMLDVLLNPDTQGGYDFEQKHGWNMVYQSVFMGLKRDVISLIGETVDLLVRGGGEKYYTEALAQCYEQFVLRTMNKISKEVNNFTAEEKAEEMLDAAGTLMDIIDKPLSVLNDNLQDALTAARYNAMEYAGYLPFQNSGVTSPKAEEMEKALNALYDKTLEDTAIRNLPESVAYRKSFEQFQAAKNKTYGPEAASKAMDWGGFVLSGVTLVCNMISTAGKLEGEKQQAAEMLVLLAAAANRYMESLQVLYNESTYRSTDPARKGLKNYIDLVEQALNATMEDAVNKGLEKMAGEIAWQRTAGDVAGLIVPVCNTVIAGVKAVKGFDLLKNLGFSSGTQLAAMAVSLISTGVQWGLEAGLHITDKYEAARSMYVIQQLIQDSSVVIAQRQDEYSKEPTHDRAVTLCRLVEHHQAMKRQGEEAAWAFISIDLEDTITKLYNDLRDEFYQEFWRQLGLGLIAGIVANPIENAMDDWTFFHIQFDVYVGDEKKECGRFLDLAMLADEYGFENIRLKPLFSDERIVLNDTIKPFLERCAAMQKMTVDIFREDFDLRAGWIEIYQPPW